MRIRVRQSSGLQKRSPERENLETFLGGPPKPVTRGQLKGIVDKIQRRLSDAIGEAAHIGLRMDGPLIQVLLTELIKEASSPGYQPENDGSVRAFFLEGLFQDLVQFPSNIFDRVTAVDGTENYIPLTAETWVAALEAVKHRLSLHT